MQKFLIVGLGNIGAEYAHTRHNIGFDVVDALARKHSAAWQTDRLGDVAQLRLKGRTITLLKPSTYMNLSGKAMHYWLQKLHVPVLQSLTVVDELALPLSKFRLRPSGSHAGHNGLRNIQEVLGTDAYPRLRFGIGNQFPKGGQVDFVLGHWDAAEKTIVAEKADVSGQLIETFVLEGIAAAMNKYNHLEFGPLA